MNTFEIPIIASSSIKSGAKILNSTGSVFDIILQDPIIMPDDIVNCTVQVDEATVWWVIPNISVNLGNNKMYFQYNAVNYVITIPTGLYSVNDLSVAINREALDATGVAGLFSVEADNATQKVNLTLNVATLQVDFTQNDTFRVLIGFNSQLVPAAPTVGLYSVLGDNIADFSNVEYFLLHSDIVLRGIRTNNVYTQTISQVLIDVAPGSQIVSREFNPPKSEAIHLSGAKIDRIRFWLTDQDNNLVDTNGENFGCRLVIKYTRKGM